MNDKIGAVMSFLFPWMKQDDDEFQDQLRSGIDSFAAPDKADGATEIERTDIHDTKALSRSYTQSFYASQPKISTTRDLINQYRMLARYPEVDNAIDEIVNDAIVFEDETPCVSLNLDRTSWNDSVKTKVQDEFGTVLRLLNFNKEGKRIFRRWYTDGRIFYHKMIDPSKQKNGIQELRLVDPRYIDLVREIAKKTERTGDYSYKGSIEYFLYSNAGDSRYGSMSSTIGNGVRIPKSAMVYAHSGKVDVDGKSVIGFLNTAIKPANQLKMLEDAMVIFRITRAPERRVFYIDVGNMPGKRATEHLNNVMQGLKNRVVYDSSTGKVKTAANNLSMTEDYWLMRRDGKQSTEVSTLPGAQGMNEIEDVRWFNRKLYEALKIPLSRLPQENGGVTFSGGGDITRDELQFSKFVDSLHSDFSPVILDPLRTNLALKNIVSADDWEQEAENIRLVFARDSYFQEIKELEIMERRIAAVQATAEVVGKYYSHDWVQRKILRMSDEEIKEERKKIDEELKDKVLTPPVEEGDEFGEEL
jgi:hypothetical protein